VIAPAHASGIPSHSIDLVTVAQALHWFDTAEFFGDARRVLVDGGAIACWGYGDPVLDDPALDGILHSFNRGLLEPYWAPSRNLLLKGYATIPFPFREVKAPRFRLEKSWTLSELAGYLRTWSATAKYIEAHGEDPVSDVERSLRAQVGGPSPCASRELAHLPARGARHLNHFVPDPPRVR